MRTTKRIVEQLTAAAERSEPLLIEENLPLIRVFRLHHLVSAVNGLIAEKALITGTGEAYSHQFNTLLGNLKEAVVMVADDKTIRSANPAFLKLISAEETPVGKRLDAIIQGSIFLEFISEVQESGEPAHQVFEAKIEDANYWIEASAAPLGASENTGALYSLFVLNDISHQKALEQMRTDFVANVSHELRTPVTVIKGFAETLLEDDAILSPEERIRFLNKILGNSERLHRLLEDLLLLTRLESTKPGLDLETIDLKSFLEGCMEYFQATAERSGVRLVMDLDPGIPDVQADPHRLHQVMSNLLENAIRHGKGATQIKIMTAAGEEHVDLVIEDNGEGIPTKDLPHIFQRFYRVDKGRSRESGGTGLGLSIVKHIIAQHGGAISAQSRVGEGTRIEISLPFNPSKSL